MEFDQNDQADPASLTSPKFDPPDEIEVNSAFGHEDMLKLRMYQEE